MVKPCDPMGFGNPMFYAVSMGRHRLIEVLDTLGTLVSSPCDSFNQIPLVHANRLDNDDARLYIENVQKTRLKNLYDLVDKNVLRNIVRRKYLIKKKAIELMQRIGRGYLGRLKFNRVAADRADAGSEDDDNSDDGEDNGEGHSANTAGSNVPVSEQNSTTSKQSGRGAFELLMAFQSGNEDDRDSVGEDGEEARDYEDADGDDVDDEEDDG